MDAAEALTAIGRLEQLAASPELCHSIGPMHAHTLQLRVHAARQSLEDPELFGAAAAIGNLVLDCITLPERALADDGVACGADDNDHLGWAFGPVIAETITAGIAALAGLARLPSLETEVMIALEAVGKELDLLAPYLFGSLCRAESQGGDYLLNNDLPSTGPSRLEQALRAICAWTLIAVGRTVGYNRLTARVLWEWSCADALWALVLVKGALQWQVAAACDTLPSPFDLASMRGAICNAVFDLVAPDVAFAMLEGGNDVTIAVRTAQLAQHKAQLAITLAESNLIGILATTVCNADVGLKVRFIRFLVAVLQPELMVDDPAWVDESYDTICMAQAVRSASAELIDILSCPSCKQALTAFLLSVAGEGCMVPGFLHDCAALAFMAPEVVAESVGDVLRAGLAAAARPPSSLDGASVSGPQDLAVLCILAANAGIRPGAKDRDDGGLWRIMIDTSVDQRMETLNRLKTWTLPVKRQFLIQWLAVLSLFPAADEPPAVADEPAAPKAPPVPPPSALPVARPELGGVRAMLTDAPVELRCALDGKLVVDPVRSPAGHVFERVVLARYLQENAGVCPITRGLLSLEDCPRDGELRRRAVAWVREHKAARSATGAV